MPDNKFNIIWAIIICIFLIWTAIYLPYRLAYIDKLSLPLLIVETLIDVIYMIDIFVNFISAYYDQDILITDRCKIVKN